MRVSSSQTSSVAETVSQGANTKCGARSRSSGCSPSCQRIGEGKLRDQVDIIFRSADNRNLPDDRIRGHELPLGKLREAIIEEGGRGRPSRWDQRS